MNNKKSGGYVQKKGKDEEDDLLSSRALSAATAPEITPIDMGDHENLF